MKHRPKRTLEIRECLAISLFIKLEMRLGEDCELRSLQGIREIVDWAKAEWRDPERVGYHVTIYGMLQPGINGVIDELRALSNHPECKWSEEKIRFSPTDEDLRLALEFIARPDTAVCASKSDC